MAPPRLRAPARRVVRGSSDATRGMAREGEGKGDVTNVLATFVAYRYLYIGAYPYLCPTGTNPHGYGYRLMLRHPWVIHADP